MKKILFTIALATGLSAQAGLMTFEQGALQIEGVNLNKTATINDSQGKPSAFKLDLLGAGLRSKTVLFVPAKAYVAQLFSDNKGAFSRDDKALTSLVTHSKQVSLKMSMIRTVAASALAISFREGLQANGYALDAELQQMLSMVEKSADAVQGKSLTLLMVKEGEKTNVYYEDASGVQKSFQGSAQLMTKIMAIWLGKSSDDGLAALKKQLLNPVY
ncbi:MAG: hypothetical protein A2622_11290 [Bdellovibrionales bacterium RIFCSPHIGHO2_01_FULL_40_29]|nr:MAG: hypothetical protein A2622_11290 [Bdellovibrionales bacterium RIFCSPHIGHO2_01_FULL_40_29]OFZ34534.1 MAG: hypothetical protein A3D17_01555 [Bdellovibrionales bacterium RIFCSPHIGHO2_02_FULL_40_15]